MLSKNEFFFFFGGDGDFCRSDEHNHPRKKDKRYK